MMKGAIAILAVSLCLVAVSATGIPQQPNAAVGVKGGAAVDHLGRKLLGGDDYNYDWQICPSFDDEVYSSARFALKVLSRSKHLLKALFGSDYKEGYECVYSELTKAYYFEDSYGNKFFLLTITFEYYGHYYTFDFVVFTTYSHHHHYSPKYLYKIVHNDKYITGAWRE